jgi:hypothetical protein
MSDFYKPSIARFSRAAYEGLRIGFDEGIAETLPSVSVRGGVRTTEVPFRTTDSGAPIVAIRQGLGMTTLPRFLGNADPLLVMMPGTDLRMHGTLWLQDDARAALHNAYSAGSLRTSPSRTAA